MKYILSIAFLFYGCFINLQAQTRQHTSGLFQGSKWFCNYGKSKYKLEIKGNKIQITQWYEGQEHIVARGFIHKGKIYTDDPIEHTIKRTAGQLYRYTEGSFGIMEVQNGDCEWYTECKK